LLCGWLIGSQAVVMGLSGCAADKGKVAAERNRAAAPFTAKAEKSLLDQLFPTVTAPKEALELGDSSLREGKEELALVYYLRAFDLDAANIQALEKMSAIYSRRGELRLMDMALQAILKVDAKHAGANESLGLLRLSGRRYAEAETLLTRSLAADPRRWRAMNALGIIADLRGDHYTAIAHYRRALNVLPGSPMLLSNIGYSHYLAGDRRLSRDYLNQALGLDPKHARAARNLALVEANEGHYQAAIGLLSRVMRTHAAYNNVGYVCMMKGDYPQAERFLTESIAQAPQYYERAHENLKQLRILEQRARQGS
jgi:Flp pilus assembly protein TadD